MEDLQDKDRLDPWVRDSQSPGRGGQGVEEGGQESKRLRLSLVKHDRNEVRGGSNDSTKRIKGLYYYTCKVIKTLSK